jgi:hypothetical protein
LKDENVNREERQKELNKQLKMYKSKYTEFELAMKKSKEVLKDYEKELTAVI